MKYIYLYLILFYTVCLPAVEPLQSNESIYIYCDKHYKQVFKDMQKEFKDTLRKREISWKVKQSKIKSFEELSERVEKELLRVDADRYIIALDYSAFWDDRKDQSINFDHTKTEEAILKII